MYSLRLVLILTLTLSWLPAQADAKISDFSWMDRNHITQQVQTVDELARTRLGSQVRGDLTDLDTLQRIVDRGLIDQKDSMTLQALGAVLGNVMAEEVRELEWKIYEDDLGRSRALCIKDTGECLFPVTMLSRRMKTGLEPNVRKVYEDALEQIDHLLPELPFSSR